MNKTLQTLRYLSKGIVRMVAFGFLTTLGSLAISYLIFYLTDQNRPRLVVWVTPPFEPIAGIFAMLIGLVLFIPNFRVALANGISRKTFLLANLPSALLYAVAFSIFNLIVVLIYGRFLPISILSTMIYFHISWAEILIIQSALYILMVVVGWFITLAYYRSSVPVKWAISILPLALLLIIQQDNARGQAITNEIRNYLSVTMLTPYRATASMLAYAVILCGLVYLLIRRAPLKD